VEAGGLISYGTDHGAHWRRGAEIVVLVLKGAKPADIPIEQPTKFELVVNLKTAKELGLTLPPTIMVAPTTSSNDEIADRDEVELPHAARDRRTVARDADITLIPFASSAQSGYLFLLMYSANAANSFGMAT
jgi:ABC-type uncharacterized transport system substrate-binding protein